MGGHWGGLGQLSSLSSLSLETVFSMTRVSVSVMTRSNVATFSLFREIVKFRQSCSRKRPSINLTVTFSNVLSHCHLVSVT